VRTGGRGRAAERSLRPGPVGPARPGSNSRPAGSHAEHRERAPCPRPAGGGFPGSFTRTRAHVRDTREHEEEIGEPVEIDDYDLRNLHLPLQVNDPALRSPAHGSGDVEGGSLPAASRNDEGLEGLQLLLAVVDGVLEVPDAAIIDVRLREVAVHFLEIGGREQRADAEEVALHGDQDLVDPRHRLDGAGHAEDGVELVDVAVGFDAGVILLNPATAEQTGVTGVAGFRIDLHATNLL
jgi:hypothetical protein